MLILVLSWQLFGNIGIDEEAESAINQHNNFRTFFNALLLLFRCVCVCVCVTHVSSCVALECHIFPRAFAFQECDRRGVA